MPSRWPAVLSVAAAVSGLVVLEAPGAAPVGRPQQSSEGVDPAECVGRGSRRRANGFMVSHGFREPLRIFRADGSGVRSITTPSRQQDSNPAWSPNGRQVAFERGRGRSVSIWRVHVASGRERRITRNPTDGSPAWSPDGRWIAFRRGGRQPGLWAVRPDGTGERVIAARDPMAVGPLGQSSWSPNGRCLVVDAQDLRGTGLALVNSRGGALRYIVRLGDAGVAAPPSWSPDGRRLVVAVMTSASPYRAYVMRVNFDGSGRRSLTRPGKFSNPLFSPDGRWIAYTRTPGGVYLRPARGGRARLAVPRRFAYAWGPQPR
jgi:Tol biopolymer transport system component